MGDTDVGLFGAFFRTILLAILPAEGRLAQTILTQLSSKLQFLFLFLVYLNRASAVFSEAGKKPRAAGQSINPNQSIEAHKAARNSGIINSRKIKLTFTKNR